MKLFTKTFGCQMNFADSDEMIGHFRHKGFDSATTEQSADAILVNTCTVRDLAEHKATSYIGRLKPWKAVQPNRLLIVTGCAAERAKKQLKHRFPHVDLIVGAKDIEQFPNELETLLLNQGVNEEELVPEHQHPAQEKPSSSVVRFVTIMRGCNYNCTYCIVPSVRGREKYIPIDNIIKQVETVVKEGAKEIYLLGQTVNSYRPPNPPKPDYDFADLLRDVNKVNGLERIRFMSPHPYYLTDKLIDAMAACDKVCEQIHLPVQSGSTRILQLMKRNYTRDSYLAALKKLREKIPGVSVTTDFIVGFPGETQKDFEQTLSLFKEADFDSAYCFKYSPRPGTPSAKMKDDVPQEEKERRLNALLELVEAAGRDKAANLIGSDQEVLIEEMLDTGVFRGRSRGQWRVRFHNPSLNPGQLVQARIKDTHSRELHAELL